VFSPARLHPIELTVNGQAVQASVPARRMLCDFLRDDLHLTGTKRGCETGVCGACTVLVNGRPLKSCLSLAVQHDHAQVLTVEGLADGDKLHPLQASFERCGGLQCGFCTPGMLMAACALLKQTPQPSAVQIRKGLAGNLCRCTGYTQIVEAVLDAARASHGN
jgi:aerobic carbon-monoxide dehydrogenase small subunit